jgi:hypothetical protein
MTTKTKVRPVAGKAAGRKPSPVKPVMLAEVRYTGAKRRERVSGTRSTKEGRP